jgi:phosphoribosylaminoimidazole carboxylase PurK protein
MPTMARLGIIGGGQLALKLIDPAHRLGHHATILDPTSKCPASQVAECHVIAQFDDPSAIRELARWCDFLTIEIETVDATTLTALEKTGTIINPTGDTIAVLQDKYVQKSMLAASGVRTPRFSEVWALSDLQAAGEEYGYPFIAKARRGGYDGRGNAVVTSADHCRDVWDRFVGVPLMAEEYISFRAELATIVVRTSRDDLIVYPIVETQQQDNICHKVIAPAAIDPGIAREARTLALNAIRLLRGRGAFGVEMFLSTDNTVFLNEIAPRVHNSGHYTIEACQVSQFEQHIRAVTGMEPGTTVMHEPFAVMVNILGDRNGRAAPQGVEDALALEGVAVHIYGKRETKIARKMGHITVVGSDLNTVLALATEARRRITI